MTISIDYNGTPGKIALQRALLLYGPSQHQFETATVHAVRQSDEGPIIGPGELLTREALIEALALLGQRRTEVKEYWIGEQSLVCLPDLRVWFTPSHQQHLFFREDAGVSSGCYGVPALLWARTDTHLFVAALDSDMRPGPDARVFRAPLPNVYSDCTVCRGTAEPASLSDESGNVSSFWNSSFTHSHHKASVAGHRSPEAYFKSVSGHEGLPFAGDLLVSLEMSIGEWIDHVVLKKDAHD